MGALHGCGTGLEDSWQTRCCQTVNPTLDTRTKIALEPNFSDSDVIKSKVRMLRYSDKCLTLLRARLVNTLPKSNLYVVNYVFLAVSFDMRCKLTEVLSSPDA